MTDLKTAPRLEHQAGDDRAQREQQEPLPTWRNTRPRGNPEPDQRDMERSRERLEALLGR